MFFKKKIRDYEKMNQIKKTWGFKYKKIIVKSWKQIFIKLFAIVMGIVLMEEFLVGTKWASNRSYYDRELQQIVCKMNLEVHWTTLFGMIGCVIIILGIFNLFHIKQYNLSTVSMVVFLIDIGAWDFLWDMSKQYFYFEIVNPQYLINLQCILQNLSYIIVLLLLLFVFKPKKEKWIEIVQECFAGLLLIVALSDLALKTVTNRWFLYQAVGVLLLTVLACLGMRIWDNNVKGEKKTGFIRNW